MPKVEAAPVGLLTQSAAALSAFGTPSGLVLGAPAPTANAVIPGTDFTVISQIRRKSVQLVFGDGGTGKTTYGLRYSPQPAFLIGFDGRSQYVELAAREAGRPIAAVQIPPPSVLQKSDNVRAAAQEALKTFFRNYDGAIAASRDGKTVRTITIDTASELGEIIVLAVRGTLENPKGDFGRSKDQINQIWWKIFGAARHTGNAHVIMLARASSIWENSEPTGDFKARVSDTVRDAVDFSLHIRLGVGNLGGLPGFLIAGVPGVGGLLTAPGLIASPVPYVPGASGRPVANKFELVVKKAGNDIRELGNVYREADWGEDGPFVYACTRLMPGSQPGDWK